MDVQQARKPTNDADLKFWIENMVRYHRYTPAEIKAATGLSAQEVEEALVRLRISREPAPEPKTDSPLVVLPYPGGRHPRIGFLDGAVDPQRETKVSVFAPWKGGGYVVVDVPEAVWSNLGLTYLAHTHVPTLWSKQGITLPQQEWRRQRGGVLSARRTLPNGVAFAATVRPGVDAVRMDLQLTNGTSEPLSDLRIQNCVMLKMAAGFEAQTNANKVFQSPFVAAKSEDGKRWIITAWDRCFHAWGNESCPCLHSDPKFADCAPGKIERLRGWLSFYEGANIDREIERIKGLGEVGA